MRQDTSVPESINVLLLTWIAGTLDGLSYLRGHVFTANMTGNLVLLAIHLVQRDMADVRRSLVSLVAFALGCILAGFLVVKHEEEGHSILKMGFAAELFLLVIYAPLLQWRRQNGTYWDQWAAISAAALALAVQSVTVRRMRVSGVVTTFITGTITTSMVGLVRIIQKLPRATSNSEEREEEHVALLLGSLVIYFAAAVCATVLSSRISWAVGLSPVVLLVAVLWRSRERVIKNG